MQEEIIVNVALAKKVTPDSIRHLAQHGDMIDSLTEDSVRPNRLMEKFKEDTWNTYENKFVYTLLEMTWEFVDKRYETIFAAMNGEVGAFMKLSNESVSFQERIKVNLDIRIQQEEDLLSSDEKNESIFSRIARIHRILGNFRASTFAKTMAKFGKIRPPLVRTNAIAKNPNFKACHKLWNFILAYTDVGYNINIYEQNTEIGDDFLQDIYNSIMVNYIILKNHLEVDQDRMIDPSKPFRKKEVKPKFIKEIVEEIVKDYDTPDVEVRKVLIEEITMEKLMQEEAATRRRLVKEKEEQDRIRAVEEERARKLQEEQEERERLRAEKIKKREEERLERERKAEEERQTREKARKELEEKKLVENVRAELDAVLQGRSAVLEERRIVAEKAEAERIAAQKAEEERIAAEKAEAERIAAEKAEAERLAAEKAEAERIAAEKAEAERIAREKAEAERKAAEKAEKKRLAAEKAAAARLAAKQAAAERIAAEKAEAERIAAEKAEAERIAAEKAEAERLAAEKAEAERIAAEKAEAERLAAEKAEAERLAAEKAEAERIAAEKAEADEADDNNDDSDNDDDGGAIVEASGIAGSTVPRKKLGRKKKKALKKIIEREATKGQRTDAGKREVPKTTVAPETPVRTETESQETQDKREDRVFLGLFGKKSNK